MNSAFNDLILADKLRKLNNSQQSIETLSHWCIFHRKRAQQVVETWDKQFRELPNDQRVSFLYLANDILQNSRRKGGEFVTEFWKILPGALKDVMEKGDDRARNVVLRLVDIWDARKVFGSRARSLQEELLGNEPPPDLPKRRVKSSHSIKIKVPLGGIQEKLSSAYRSVHDVASNEDATLGRCNAAVIRIEGLEKESNLVCNTQGESQDRGTLADELQEQENILNRCVEQLEMSEMARGVLVSHLKEALREQESKLELIRTQLQIARAQAEHGSILGEQLCNGLSHSNERYMSADSSKGEKLPWQPSTSIGIMAPVVDVSKSTKSASSVAAEVAAKLAASASSAQVLTSVLSTIVAEEASNMATSTASLDSTTSNHLPEKRRRLNGQTDYIDGSHVYPSILHPSPPLHNMVFQNYSGMQHQHSSASQQLSLARPPVLPQPPSVIIQGMGFNSLQPPPLPMHVVGVPRAVMPPRNPILASYQIPQPQPVPPPPPPPTQTAPGFYAQPTMPGSRYPHI